MAFSGGSVSASGSSRMTTVSSGPGMAGGSLLGTVNTVDQADDGRRQEESAGNDDGIVEDLNEHDVGSFLRAFSMVLLYAFIGALYIDKSAKVGVAFLCSFMYMWWVYVL